MSKQDNVQNCVKQMIMMKRKLSARSVSACGFLPVVGDVAMLGAAGSTTTGRSDAAGAQEGEERDESSPSASLIASSSLLTGVGSSKAISSRVSTARGVRGAWPWLVEEAPQRTMCRTAGVLSRLHVARFALGRRDGVCRHMVL